MASPLDMKGTRLGGYEIVERLGAGGMGTVYKARDASLDRFVAIKVLAPALETDAVCVQRFEREAKSIAALRHPNLMHIYAVGEEQGLHYFAMEYIEGVPLSKYMGQHRQMSLDEIMRVTGQIMGALHKVHSADIYHRDLKPGNVMIDTDGRPVLMDFGLAKDTSAPELTGAGAIMGTPDYMAPEQIEGDPVGPYTDIYALSIMLFEMLTHSKPFHRKSAVLTMRAHCEETPPPLTNYRSDLPKPMAAVLRKGMAREPAKRYQSIPAMAQDLVRLCAVPALAELAQEYAAPSSAKTILSGSGQATASKGASASLDAPTVDAPPRASKIPRRRRATRAKRVAVSKPEAKHPARRLTRLHIGLLVAGAFLLLLVGIWLGRRGNKGRRLPRVRYMEAEHGQENPRVRVLMRDGSVVYGTILESGEDGLKLRKDDSPAPIILAPGSWKVIGPAPTLPK